MNYNFINNADDFNTGFKNYKKERSFYRFTVNNGTSPLEGAYYENNEIISVTKDTGLEYLLYCIYNGSADIETIELLNVIANTVKPDEEEEFWYYVKPTKTETITTFTKEQLETLINQETKTVEVIKGHITRYKDIKKHNYNTVKQLRKSLKEV